MATQVINIRNAPPGWQSNPDYVLIDRTTEWGNPFVLGTNGTIEEVIAKHKDMLLNGNRSYLLSQLELLRDKILVCHCKPRLCHGDTYVELLNLKGS